MNLTKTARLTFLKLSLLLILQGAALNISAQEFETLRGKITGKSTQAVINNALVQVKGIDGEKQTQSDSLGKFRFDNLSPGRYLIQVTAEGYSPIVLNNIQHSSGKETVLNLEMEEEIVTTTAVKIGVNRGSRPINNLALTSARSFSVEETQRYAAALNDPSRMAASFPGVNTPSDGNNFISVRGNSPNALLWRMEGVDIPNPNHFSNTGAQGGGISILSAQLLSNSDFITGAFPAEYGNALGGVFDLKLRTGNNEKHERTLQLGLLGMEAAAEGPISKKKESSYLINYRNSTLSILSKLGIVFIPSVTNFSDLSYHFNYHFSPKVSMSFFGFTGWSNQTLMALKDTAKRDYRYQWHDFKYGSNTSIAGLKTNFRINKNHNLSWTNAYTYVFDFESDLNRENESNPFEAFKTRNYTQKISSYAMLNSRLSNKVNLRSGFNLNFMELNYRISDADSQRRPVELVRVKGQAFESGLYSQARVRFNPRMTLVGGLHTHYFSLASQTTLEPRLAMQYALSRKTSLTASAGMHSQLQPMIVYFSKDAAGNYLNRQLKLSRAKHYVAGIKHALNPDWNLGLETYYQQLYDIPVSANPASTLSLLNQVQGYVTEKLVNKGNGRNYGVEVTVEKSFKRSTYLLAAMSLYRSQYQALDRVWRMGAFSGGRTLSLTLGKEWKFRNKKNVILGFNTKVLWLGGNREMPVLFNQSKLEGHTVYDLSGAYNVKLPDYFRADVRVNLRRNGRKTASVIALDIQNVTNHKNVGGTFYDVDANKIVREYQLPLIPVLSYKLEF